MSEEVKVPKVPAKKVLDKVDQLLIKGADYLDGSPWCQRRLFDEFTGAVCALGAMSKLEVDNPENNDSKLLMPVSSKAVQKSYRYFKAIGVESHTIVDYNDDPDRTKEEVQAMMYKIGMADV